MSDAVTLLQSAAAHGSTLRRGYYIAVSSAAMVIVLTASPANVESGIGAVAVLLASVLPAGLWVNGKAKGIPLFPVFAVTHAWTYGLPLLYEHPIVLQYPPDRQLLAALTAAGYLIVGTAVWFAIARRPVQTPVRCIQLKVAGADYLFVGALVFGIVGTIALSREWIALPGGVSTIIRAIIIAVQALACFVLSYELGARRLSTDRVMLFILLLAGLMMTQVATLLLVGAMSILAISVFGYTLGSGRFPWPSVIVAIVIFAFLHAGKGPIREKYWGTSPEDVRVTPGIAEYPNLLVDWVGMSVTSLAARGESGRDDGQTLIERASLMQLLLHVQAASPDSVPFLYGETYAILPTLLVPRILMPDKPASHEGTYLLNIHYGFQTREATETTTIGFGLLNEAYANFGYFGVGMLAIIISAFYGAVGLWGANVPVLSLRSLFGVIVASYSFQSEFAAGVYLSALFQSSIALLLVAALFMRSAPVQPDRRTSVIA